MLNWPTSAMDVDGEERRGVEREERERGSSALFFGFLIVPFFFESMCVIMYIY